MSTRYRTVALQAVGVAVLAAVIFVAFLRPSEPSDLSGIEAQGGNEPPTAVNTQPDDEKKKGDKKNQRDDSKGDSRRQGRNVNRNGNAGQPGGGRNGRGNGRGTGDTSGSDSLGGNGDTPTGSQYGDLVTRLLQEVGAPDALAKFGRTP